MPGTAFTAAVDWGTSSLRLWLLAEDGTILGERRSAEGMQAAAAGAGFAPILEGHLSALGADASLSVIVCGMAGARQGWVEAPYADTPAGVARIAEGAIRVPGISRDVRILPGVAQRGGTGADVMRGEETIIMGLSLLGEVGLQEQALVCLPGTHSKWALVEGGRIVAYSSFMTGEVFALLGSQSILRHTIAPDADPLALPDVFDDAVRASLAEPAMLLNRIFSIRAGGLFGTVGAEAATATLSGLLIGQELAGVRALWPGNLPVTLASSGRMLALYRRALDVAGMYAAEADADAAVRAGLLAAAHHCFRT